MWGRDVSVNLLASDFKALSVSLGKYKWMVDTLLCDCPFSLVALKLLNMYERKGIKERTNENTCVLGWNALLFLKGKRGMSATGDASARCLEGMDLYIMNNFPFILIVTSFRVGIQFFDLD